MQNSLTRKPIEIKISTVVAVAILLHEASISVLEAALKEMTSGSPDFFDDEFAVIDVEAIADATVDWNALIPLFKSQRPPLLLCKHQYQHRSPSNRRLSFAIILQWSSIRQYALVNVFMHAVPI